MTDVTIDRTAARDMDVAGIRARRVVTVTGPTSYETGGVGGWGGLKHGTIEAFPAGGVIFCNGSAVRLGWFDHATDKMQFFVPDTGSEVANGTDLSGYTARIESLGTL